MSRRKKGGTSENEASTVNRRQLMRTLGAGATVSAVGVTALTGTAAAHNLQVEFPDCQTVLIVVNDTSEFGVLKETIHVYDADTDEVKAVSVELTPENTESMPDRFGDKPVYAAEVSGNDHIVGVETGDGQMFENPNDCPREAEEAEEDADEDGLSNEVIIAHTDPESVEQAEDYVSYVFEVTGDLEELEPDEDVGVAVDEVIDQDDRVRVEGAVGTGDDRFAFSGELIEVEIPSILTVEVRER